MTSAREHVTGHLADYVAGRLGREGEAMVEEHVRTCTACRAELEIARGLRGSSDTPSAGHLTPERIAALSSDPSTTREDERAHLDDCRSCRADLTLATTAVDDVTWRTAIGNPAPRSAPRRRVRAGRGIWMVPLGVAAVVAGILWLDARDVRDLARLEALPVPIERSAEPVEDGDSARVEAFELYRSGDYEAAGERLAPIARTRELQLYLGSARLLGGDAAGAIDVLESLVSEGDAGTLHDEAQWQLANAYLAAGRPDRAVDRLRDVVAGGGRRATEARELLVMLGSSD